MDVPFSNDNRPKLPQVEGRFLMMAAAGIQQRLFDPNATFTDDELSKNLEDRRGATVKDELGTMIEAMIDKDKGINARQGNTPRDIGITTSARVTGGDTIPDLPSFERSGTVTPR